MTFSIAIRTDTSPKIAALSEVTQANQIGYAEKHGYEWVCEPFDYDNFNDNAVAAMKSIRGLLTQKKTVMWVGADVMFMNWKYRIEEVASLGSVVMARERTGWWPINNDVVIYNNCRETFRFLDRMIDDFEVWKQYPWRQQTHTWNLMQEEEWVARTVRLVEPEVMNQHPSKFQLGNWIVHFYAMPVEEKIGNARIYAHNWPDGKPIWKTKHDGVRPAVK